MTDFSDKEKDEAGLPDDFRQDSLDAFILRFAGVKAFLFFALFHVHVSAGQAVFEDENEDENEDDSFRAGLSTENPFREFFHGAQLKDQPMKKVRFVLLALAGLSVLSVARATVIIENFSANPLQDGWRIFGDTNLFQWDSNSHNLAVTWDSSQPNSFFYHPLGTILTRNDDFSIAFDLKLNDIASGTDAGMTGGFEIGLGFLNFANATSTNFLRGVFYPFNVPTGAINLVEFDYFPAGYFPDFGPVSATTTPTFISTNGDFAPCQYLPYEIDLPTNVLFRVTMTYTASNQTLVTLLTTNGLPFLRLLDITLTDPDNSGLSDADDFRVDTISINSYSDAGQDPSYGSSVLAHGIVGNFVVAVPPPPVQKFSGSFSETSWQAQFISQSNWFYTLERTADFDVWTDASPVTCGNGTNLFLPDMNAPTDRAFYRVRAERP
jgi:hypothetical protein